VNSIGGGRAVEQPAMRERYWIVQAGIPSSGNAPHVRQWTVRIRHRWQFSALTCPATAIFRWTAYAGRSTIVVDSH